MNSGDVVVYSTDPCSFCTQAKALLTARKIVFTEINLSKDPAGRDQLVQRTGMTSFPQIMVGGQPVGGFRELVMADRDGSLKQLLAA